MYTFHPDSPGGKQWGTRSLDDALTVGAPSFTRHPVPSGKKCTNNQSSLFPYCLEVPANPQTWSGYASFSPMKPAIPPVLPAPGFISCPLYPPTVLSVLVRGIWSQSMWHSLTPVTRSHCGKSRRMRFSQMASTSLTWPHFLWVLWVTSNRDMVLTACQVVFSPPVYKRGGWSSVQLFLAQGPITSNNGYKTDSRVWALNCSAPLFSVTCHGHWV